MAANTFADMMGRDDMGWGDGMDGMGGVGRIESTPGLIVDMSSIVQRPGMGWVGRRGACHIAIMHNILIITGQVVTWQGGSILSKLKGERVPPRVAEAVTA